MSLPTNSEDFDVLEKLALALLIHPGDPRVSNPHLFLGKIPEKFPVEIPIPDQSRVLGTLARSETQVEIVLESELTSEEVFSFYRAHFTARSWRELEDLMQSRHGSGFLHTAFGPHMALLFFQESDAVNMMLNISSTENATTTVRLNLSLDQAMNATAQQSLMQHQAAHRSMRANIPPLASPQDAQQRSGNGGTGFGEVYTTGTLTTDLALDVLAAHYADQLIKAGWTQADAGTSGFLAWHSWHFTDENQEPWNGLFFIFKTPDRSDDYFLYIRAVWNKPQTSPKFSGWLSGNISLGTSSTILGNQHQPAE